MKKQCDCGRIMWDDMSMCLDCAIKQFGNICAAFMKESNEFLEALYGKGEAV